MSFFWFGDSWTNGDELRNEVPVDKVSQYTFAHLVSEHFKTTCYNYAVNASSIPHLLTQLNNARNQINEGDVLFFGLTGSDRTCVIDSANEVQHLFMTASINDTRVNQSLNKIWYKYVDTIPQRSMTNCSTLDLIKSYCVELNVTCWFYNVFTMQTFDDCKLVSDEWLIESTDCLSSEILHVFDNEYFTVISSDRPEISNVQWDKQNKLLETYFRPNYVHPNVRGHQALSNRLINIINEITTR